MLTTGGPSFLPSFLQGPTLQLPTGARSHSLIQIFFLGFTHLTHGFVIAGIGIVINVLDVQNSLVIPLAPRHVPSVTGSRYSTQPSNKIDSSL